MITNNNNNNNQSTSTNGEVEEDIENNNNQETKLHVISEELIFAEGADGGAPIMVASSTRQRTRTDNAILSNYDDFGSVITNPDDEIRKWWHPFIYGPKFKPGTKKYQAYLSFQTLGIIYGDIGTSPLYTFSSIFANGPPNENDVIGALSLMIWSLLLILILKYVTFVLIADDHGEGGTFAMYSLLRRGLRNEIKDEKKYKKFSAFFSGLAIIGVSAVLADGVLTPAISVLGAIQGITIASPNLGPSAVIAISAVILFFLYLFQSYGTARISFLFSPIIFCWFIALVSIGIYNIIQYPSVLVAFSPYYAGMFFVRHGYEAWVSLGAIFLTVTGAEALFADLGHFNANAVRLAFCCFVFPSLLICYCGQGAALIINPTIVTNTFYLGMPNEALIPMLILATLASIIASQALISASFSLISQAMRLQFVPRMTIKHTNKDEIGQVYVPEINYFYMILVIIVIIAYQNATALGYAYGIAVSSVFFVTTIFYSMIMIYCFHRHWFWAICFFIFFGFIDVAFLSSNLLKFPTGGWFSVVLASFAASIMALWQWGRVKMTNYQKEQSVPDTNLFNIIYEDDQLADDEDVELVTLPRNSLTICYSSVSNAIPATYAHFLKCYPVRPKHLVFVTLTAVNVPFVQKHLTITPILNYENVYRASVNYGYAEPPPAALKLAGLIIRRIHCVTLSANRPISSELDLIKRVNLVFLVGHDVVIPKEESSTGHQLLVNAFSVLLGASRSIVPTLHIPPHMTFDVGLRIPI